MRGDTWRVNPTKVDKIRIARGYTIDDLAKYTGMARSTIYRWCKSQSDYVAITDTSMVMLTRILDINPSDITP